jgi:hypothetical protein
MKKISLIPVVSVCLGIASVLTLTGCWAVAGGAGAGTVAYIDGSVGAPVDATLSKTQKAALKAMDDLKYTVISQNEDAQYAEIIARNAKDEKIKVAMEFVSDASTKIEIRVGVFGDQELSLQILEKIKKHL